MSNNKWISDYIENVNLDNIEWVCFDVQELEQFYEDNYLDYDLWQYVIDDDRSGYYCSPIGLRYLNFDNNGANYKFLLGVVSNNIKKKTIVAAMIYLEDYYMFVEQMEPLTYISSLEVNKFFWNKGIYKRLCEEVIKFVNVNQHIILSMESEMGRMCDVGNKFINTLRKDGFDKLIVWDEYSNYSKIGEMVCSKKKILGKNI